MSRELFTEIKRSFETLPSGRLIAVRTMGPDDSYRAGNRVCDCCLQAVNRYVRVDHWGFGMQESRIELMQGWWAYCVYCWALYSRGEIEPLVARVLTLNTDLDERVVRQLYSVLPYVMHGEPRAVGDILESEL